MSAVILADKTFTIDDQHGFAKFSGDANPIHIDPLTARRSLAGEPVVHGIHLVLWSLEAVCNHIPDLPPIAGLRVKFEKMVTIGMQAQAVLVDRKNERIRIDVNVDGRAAVVIIASLHPAAARGQPFRRGSLFGPLHPLDNTLEDIEGMAGQVTLPAQASNEISLFSRLARNIGPARIAGLAATTFIVGMVCPGLFSIFRSLELSTMELQENESALYFEVSSIDPRFQLARLAVSGQGWIGTLDAHARPRAVVQPSFIEVSRHVQEGEFNGKNALVIGGSRGLGEVLAKILAAGGAAVTITYRTGEADALGVQAEILAAGGVCEVAKYDVTTDSPDKFASSAANLNQLYFMASPQIKPSRSGDFSAALFASYTNYYVNAFSRVVFSISELYRGEIAIFYPSTVYVTDPKEGFLEYAAAKTAGENICKGFLAQGVVKHAIIGRLPRFLTDQTRSMTNEVFPEVISPLIAIARSLNVGELKGELQII